MLLGGQRHHGMIILSDTSILNQQWESNSSLRSWICCPSHSSQFNHHSSSFYQWNNGKIMGGPDWLENEVIPVWISLDVTGNSITKEWHWPYEHRQEIKKWLNSTRIPTKCSGNQLVQFKHIDCIILNKALNTGQWHFTITLQAQYQALQTFSIVHAVCTLGLNIFCFWRN